MTVERCGYVYNAKNGYGIKIGSSSFPTTSLNLKTTEAGKYKPTKITVTACSADGSKKNLDVKINDSNHTFALSTVFHDFDINMDGNTDLESIELATKNGAVYVKSIVVVFEGEQIKTSLSWSKSECLASAIEHSFPKLTVVPEGLEGITYSSSNENVAEISTTGDITIKGAGTAIITASFSGGSKYDTAESKSYTLHVVNDNYIHDFITYKDLAATSTTYADFSGKQFNSEAVYAGNTSKNTSAISMRTSSSSGIVSTHTGGNIKKVSVIWNSLTTLKNKIDIYAKKDLYTAYGNLFSSLSGDKGYLKGSIEYDSNTKITISGDYQYVGIRSNANTVYLDEIDFAWEPVSDKVSISSVGYSTYYNSAYAYTMPEGVEGYVFYCDDNKDWKLEKAYGSGVIVPAGEPLVLKGTSNNYTLHFTNSSSASLTSQGKNALCGTDLDADLVADDNSYFYALTLDENNAASSVGFYWMNETGSAFTNGAHKVYLKMPKNSADSNVRGFAFEDIINSIESPSVERTKSGRIYDMSGREVKNPSKGLYIENGIRRYYK